MLEEELEAGRRQWTIAWRYFARQWTQPQLLKLADAVMGGRYLHSSQISGFATGKLREPAPKVFVVIGRLNQAIATSELPPEVKELGEGKQILKDKDGQPLDSVGCFRAFTGNLKLDLETPRVIPKNKTEEANRCLSSLLRKGLQRTGVNIVDELPDIIAKCGQLSRSLLIGEQLNNKQLEGSMQEIEEVLRAYGSAMTKEQIWEKLSEAIN